MRRWGLAVIVASLATTTTVAHADDNALYERLWPAIPHAARLSLSQQITDGLTELGNTFGAHLSTLSNGELGLTFDGRRRRAKIRFGSSDTERFLVFKLASDIHFRHGVARIQTRIDLGIGKHLLQLELPDFEMAPAEYRGERGVVIRLPLFTRAF